MAIIVDVSTEGNSGSGNGIPVSDLLRRFRNIMLDVKSIRWSVQEAIDWMNDGASEIVLRRPAARAVTVVAQLEAGTFQRAPLGFSQVLDIPRNRNTDGRPGRSIRIADRQQIDDVTNGEWHRMRAGPIKHYMIDERSPTTFYVYPPAVRGALVEFMGAQPAPKVTLEADTLDMRPEFINAILNWMMYRAHTKDSEYSQGGTAALHYQAFTDAIGAPSQAAQLNAATGNSK